MITKLKIDNTKEVVLFFLNSFFVVRVLNKNITQIIVSINKTIQKIMLESFCKKLFTSFKFIHKLEKKLTSWGVLAFNTINVKNTQPKTKTINKIAAKKLNAFQADILGFLFCIFWDVVSIFFTLKKIFSHKLVGTTFVISSISWFSNL